MADSHDFTWGVATASYQVEGAWREGGKGFSIWDAFAHTPGKIANNENGDVACNQYHLYETDVKLMQELGVGAYRFSIAWSRIIPDGKGKPNPDGIAYYNRLIDCLLAHGIKPFVTLYHWDLPLALQFEDDGWLGYATAEAFGRYAKVCFDAFGDRVRDWITFNESWCSAVLGHGLGVFAPGRISPDEPYLAAHNLILAHGLAVKAFREGGYAGQIGTTNNCDWREPKTDSASDQAAAQRSLEFFYAWFTDPIIFGDYPAVMRERLGDRLPTFTPEQRAFVQGSTDFLGLNHYTTLFAAEATGEEGVDNVAGNGGMADDQGVTLTADPIWSQTSMKWNIVPWGFRKLLNWIADRYPGLPIYVTENGCAEPVPASGDVAADPMRAEFITRYIQAMQQAIKEDGVDVRGYFCWSLLDNFEWVHGYSQRFGLIHTDYETLVRTPKQSYHRYQQIIRQAGQESSSTAG